MRARTWLALAIAVLVAASFAASVVAAKRAGDDRPKYVTRGLDFLHARQDDKGGFASPSNTSWGILGAVASGERMGSSAWKVAGKSPFTYLESINHEAAATGAEVDNAPVYYAHTIMAYVAVAQRDRVFIAGTPRVDLLAKLYAYQDWAATMPDPPRPDTWGSFSPSASTPKFDAVHTTSWAILAMHSFGLDNEKRYLDAAAWLVQQQQAGGGFPSQVTRGADVLNTALAIQALVAAPDGTVDPLVLANARQYLKTNQNSGGGFPIDPGERTHAEATAAVIQAIVALGERPDDEYWKAGAGTPVTALGALLQKNGSYKLTSKSAARPLAVTSWALVAMRRKSFSAYPKDVGRAETAFAFRPRIRYVAPRNGAKFKHTRIVLIRARYTDFYPKGTGIKPSASRVYVDNVNKSRPAKISKYGLTLQLKDVPNGSHTYRIELVDNAGNRKTLQRKFSVDVKAPAPAPDPQPTYNPNPAPVYPPTYPTAEPTTSRTTFPTPTPAATPTPYETDTPYPPSGPPTVSGSPIPSPSASASPAGADGSGGGGSAAGFVGGTLLAMLPIGAVASYLLLQRREGVLGGASQGVVLDGGGSAWDRFKQMLAKSKDLTKPSSRS